MERYGHRKAGRQFDGTDERYSFESRSFVPAGAAQILSGPKDSPPIPPSGCEVFLGDSADFDLLPFSWPFAGACL